MRRVSARCSASVRCYGSWLLLRAGEAILIGVATITAFWSLSSLLVSYYVYDYKGVIRWNWLPPILSFPPQQWLNIHAGLDESTLILTQCFPNTRYVVVDIYDPQEMTEPSIARARRLHLSPEPAIAGKLDALPLRLIATAIHLCSLPHTKSVNLLTARCFSWSPRESWLTPDSCFWWSIYAIGRISLPSAWVSALSFKKRVATARPRRGPDG